MKSKKASKRKYLLLTVTLLAFSIKSWASPPRVKHNIAFTSHPPFLKCARMHSKHFRVEISYKATDGQNYQSEPCQTVVTSGQSFTVTNGSKAQHPDLEHTVMVYQTFPGTGGGFEERINGMVFYGNIKSIDVDCASVIVR